MSAAPLRVAISVARFNEKVTRGLLDGALALLEERGLSEHCEVHWVEGAFELPLSCQWLCETHRFDGIIALGSVVLGETDHYEHICTQAARGLMDLNLRHSLPIGFGILTCKTAEQAYARSAPGEGNKGAEAALAVIEMIELRRKLTN